jgi:hypothetical protein
MFKGSRIKMQAACAQDFFTPPLDGEKCGFFEQRFNFLATNLKKSRW